MDLLEQLTYGDEGKLYINDALLTISVCAAGADEEYSPEETDRIVALTLANNMFRNEAETVKKRVFHLVNSISAGERQAALDRAVKSLPEEMKETAFAWAIDVITADGILPDENREFIWELAAKLSVGSEIAAEIIKVMAIRNRTIPAIAP
jgi:tellurite resistance protein